MTGTAWRCSGMGGAGAPAGLHRTLTAIKTRPPSIPSPLSSLPNSLSHRTTAIRSSSSSNPQNDSSITESTPALVKLAVTGVTEFLRLLSPGDERFGVAEDVENKDDVLVSGVDDVVDVLKSDYKNAYFVTGVFTRSIYASDCVFEDPIIKFRGTDLYYRNLKLLVPFFDQASIVLQEMEKGVTSEGNFVQAKWRLRTYLKLPWRPLIAIEGSTIYDLSDEFKIVRHAESWNVSAIKAISQIFTPGSRNSDE